MNLKGQNAGDHGMHIVAGTGGQGSLKRLILEAYRDNPFIIQK